jgi:hypothetical protein
MISEGIKSISITIFGVTVSANYVDDDFSNEAQMVADVLCRVFRTNNELLCFLLEVMESRSDMDRLELDPTSALGSDPFIDRLRALANEFATRSSRPDE